MRRHLHRGILVSLRWLRESRVRRPILRRLVWLHNASYQLITLFASVGERHPKHQIVQYHTFFVDNISADDTVLDVGCGQGDVTFAVAKKARQVTGIDISPDNIARARRKSQRSNVQFIVADATTYRFPEPATVIILSNVLEHIEHRVQFLRRLRAIAPKILIRVPAITRDWVSVYKKNEGLEYRLDPTHCIEYDERTLRQELTEAGLTITHVHTTFGEFYVVTHVAATSPQAALLSPAVATTEPVPAEAYVA